MTNKQAYAGLLERLRRTVIDRMCPGAPLEILVNPDGPEAAEAISSLLKALEAISKEAKVANDVIRLGRDDEGSGRVKVATAMHRIAAQAEAALNSDAPLSIGEGDRG